MITQIDEESLAKQACVNANAFAELYRRHVAQVYRYHLIHTGSTTEAEDLTSQTFMAALDGIAGYRNTGAFAAWLMGIARPCRPIYNRSGAFMGITAMVRKQRF
jgi:RNA polymerase sigma-70 factor (ECF subfamily)